MISAVRDQALALACLRLGLPAREARGIDRLPSDITRPLESGLIRGLERADLARAFQATTEGLAREIRLVDADLAARLGPALVSLVESIK
jgi:hypothetical protein